MVQIGGEAVGYRLQSTIGQNILLHVRRPTVVMTEAHTLQVMAHVHAELAEAGQRNAT